MLQIGNRVKAQSTCNRLNIAHAHVSVLRPEVNSAELFGQREREPASIGQVERLIGADVDAGRIHRLAVIERPAQIEAAIAALRQFS